MTGLGREPYSHSTTPAIATTMRATVAMATGRLSDHRDPAVDAAMGTAVTVITGSDSSRRLAARRSTTTSRIP